eukprot:2730617-Pyramimonas_sp.AAC.1
MENLCDADGRRRAATVGDGRRGGEQPALAPRWFRQVRTPLRKHCLGKIRWLPGRYLVNREKGPSESVIPECRGRGA